MSKANLLRHPFGVSMTTFKLPDFESNGGNLLSKFIGVLQIRYSWLDRAGVSQCFHRLLLVMVWLRCQSLSGGRLALPDLLSFPKRKALGAADISFEIAFHQLQGLRVLFRGIRNNAVRRDS